MQYDASIRLAVVNMNNHQPYKALAVYIDRYFWDSAELSGAREFDPVVSNQGTTSTSLIVAVVQPRLRRFMFAMIVSDS